MDIVTMRLIYDEGMFIFIKRFFGGIHYQPADLVVNGAAAIPIDTNVARTLIEANSGKAP